MSDQEATPTPPRRSARATAIRVLWHLAALLIAVASLAGYLHFRLEGPPAASITCLLSAAGFGFVPLRDLVRIVFKVEGPVLHLVHTVGAVVLALVPFTGAVPSVPILTHAALAPFAMMGAAQAIMHQNQPRNSRQAAALRQFATSLPEVAAVADSRALSSPENARRAIAALSDIIAKAQVLGQTELEADPGFQAALRRSTTRVGLSFALDAIEASLNNLPASEATAGAIQALRTQLATARRAFDGHTPPGSSS